MRPRQVHDKSQNETFLPVDAAYDRWAAGYDALDNPMVAGASIVMETLGREAAGMSVFEFGCGTGRNLAAFKRLGATRVSGCDLSEGMLALAIQRDSALPVFRHDMSSPLSEDGPASPGSFDRVLFCLTLEHVADMTTPLQAAARLLRPAPAGNAQVEIIEIHPLVAAGGVAAHFEDAGVTVRMPAFAHTFAEYETAFRAAGLREVARRDWRPVDFGDAATRKMCKRGAEFPLLAQFRAVLE